MKNVKIVFWIIVVGLICLVVFQNQDFFMMKKSLTVDFYFFNYKLIPLPNLILFIFIFWVGFGISYLLSFSNKLKSKQLIKELELREISLKNALLSLQKELKIIKESEDDKTIII